MPNKFYGPLSDFLSLSKIFHKTFTIFCDFSSKISLFLTRAGTISSIVVARISEDFFFLIARIFNKGSFKRLFY